MAYNPVFDKRITEKFYKLNTEGKVQAEYIWLGNILPVGEDIRLKTRTLDLEVDDVSNLPEWNYDGSSTGQAPGHDSEVVIRPRRIYRDPFRGAPHILVLCDTYAPDGTPIPSNTRAEAARIFELVKDEHIWFGLEQEYALFSADHVPLGWPRNGYPAQQGPYYCSVGTENAFGRDVVEAHYRACLYAGVKIAGINSEVLPGQWEFQIGPSEGIQAADDLTLARFLLHRIAEEFGITVSFDPKPIPGDWNGSGCHTNVSTLKMRQFGGYEYIKTAIEKLGKKHAEHIAVYGAGNERRLTGRHETASIGAFRWGVADRGASVRVPRATEAQGFGYFEDRRPASNLDPYLVTARIAKTILVDDPVNPLPPFRVLSPDRYRALMSRK